jgi:NADH dehydrogenase [ubiquinone] 1 alpha subcomplex assembly factor 5
MSIDLFDRRARRHAFERSARASEDAHWLLDRMADELCDRLLPIKRPFYRALIIGPCAAQFKAFLEPRGVACWHCAQHESEHPEPRTVVGDEDFLPFADNMFDLVIACGTLDSVNDVPGALALIRRILRPNGLFLGAMFAAGTLARLKQGFAEAMMKEGGPAISRFHPQIDVRAAGDLLSRAGFSMPVADQDSVVARYPNMTAVIADVRAMGMSNLLTDRSPLSRKIAALASIAFAAKSDPDGKTTESFAITYLTGWAPAPGEQRPAGPVRQFVRAGQ